MELRNHLIDTFKFNDVVNKRLIEKIKKLPDKKESIRLFSHLINCQIKWMARIDQNENSHALSWWEPIYSFDELEIEWNKSLGPWLNYLDSSTDEEISEEKTFIGFDGGLWAAAPKDIALQLNYHSIHHRAQIQMIIRQQGFEPDFLDYIRTKYRKVS